jgi:rhodanese-related sulfurtransferase
MQLGLVFTALGIASAVGAARGGGAWLVLGWPALAFTLVGAGYLGVGARILGKRADGRRSPAVTLVFMPYFAMVHVGRALVRAAWPEPPFDEVSPGVFVGRRCAPAELPAGVGMVVDLTAELDALPGLPAAVGYRCLPTLDGHAPRLDALEALVGELVAFEDPVYVHCAAGHGRSAMVAAALLLRRGTVGNLEEAERTMRRARPRVRLAEAQRRVIRQLTSRAR